MAGSVGNGEYHVSPPLFLEDTPAVERQALTGVSLVLSWYFRLLTCFSLADSNPD